MGPQLGLEIQNPQFLLRLTILRGLLRRHLDHIFRRRRRRNSAVSNNHLDSAFSIPIYLFISLACLSKLLIRCSSRCIPLGEPIATVNSSHTHPSLRTLLKMYVNPSVFLSKECNFYMWWSIVVAFWMVWIYGLPGKNFVWFGPCL